MKVLTSICDQRGPSSDCLLICKVWVISRRQSFDQLGYDVLNFTRIDTRLLRWGNSVNVCPNLVVCYALLVPEPCRTLLHISLDWFARPSRDVASKLHLETMTAQNEGEGWHLPLSSGSLVVLATAVIRHASAAKAGR